MIRFNDEGLFRPDEVGMPVFQRLDDSEKLPFINVVVLFRGGECVGIVCNRMSVRFGVWRVRRHRPPFLGQDGPHSVSRGVGL